MAPTYTPVRERVQAAQDALCTRHMRVRRLKAAGKDVPLSLSNEVVALQKRLETLLREQDERRAAYRERHGTPVRVPREAQGLDVFQIMQAGLA
jgi:hypothetical protein